MTAMTVKQCRDQELEDKGDIDDNTPIKTIKAREISSSDSDSDSDSDSGKNSLEQTGSKKEDTETASAEPDFFNQLPKRGKPG